MINNKFIDLYVFNELIFIVSLINEGFMRIWMSNQLPIQQFTAIKDKILFSLSPQQKKVMTVVALIFSGLAAFYVFSRYCFKAKVEDPILKNQPQAPVISDQQQAVNTSQSQELIEIEEKSQPKVDEEITETMEDGTQIIGKWVDDRFQGAVKVIRPNGNTAEFCIEETTHPLGNSKDRVNYMNGPAKFRMSDGTIYEGIIEEGKMNLTKVKLVNGMVWEGTAKEGWMNGPGKLTMPDGAVYEETFTDSLMNGLGKLTMSDGAVYEGAFKDGLMNGLGQVTMENGTVLEGTFKNSEINGLGQVTIPNKGIIQVIFKDNEILEVIK